MKLQYFSLITSRTPCSIHSGSMYCGIDAEPLGQRVALRRQLLAHLVRAREGVLGRDVVAVRRQPAEVGGAGLDQLGPPVGEVRRHLDPDVGHQPPALGDQPLHVVDRSPGSPSRAAAARARSRHVGSASLRAASVRERSPPTAAPRRLVGDLGDLPPVVAGVRDEVLQDHLLEVAVARMDLGQRFERGDPLLLGLADADQDPAGERDPQLAGGLDRRQPRLPGAWSASRRGPSPSAARRPTRASGPARRSPRAAGPGPRCRGRRGWCAAGCRARAPARRPRRRRR